MPQQQHSKIIPRLCQRLHSLIYLYYIFRASQHGQIDWPCSESRKTYYSNMRENVIAGTQEVWKREKYRQRFSWQKKGQTWPLAQVLPMCCTVSSATESGNIPAHSMVTTEYSSIPVRIKHHWLMQACPSSEVSSNPHWTTSSHPPYRVMLL